MMTPVPYDARVTFPPGFNLEYTLFWSLNPGCAAEREADVDLWMLHTSDGEGTASVGDQIARLKLGEDLTFASTGVLSVTSASSGSDEPLLVTIFGLKETLDARQ